MLFFKKFLLVFILALVFVFQAFSQKRVKYKDLFPVLQSKDYTSAEPLLIQYLSDNPDEANPHFYFGEILTAKLDSTEIFPDRKIYDSLANAAIISYKKAIRLVDDREIRKNDDYYIAYNRRDLRTGKFGIKISDVHLDYENKIAILTEKVALIDKIFQQKVTTDSVVAQINIKLESLKEHFPNEKAFLLRSNMEDFDMLRNVNKNYVSLKEEVDDYLTLLDQLKSANIAPALKIEAVQSWTDINAENINLFEEEIRLRDYQSFFSLILLKIENEIIPLKSLLSETDQALNDIIEKNQNITDSSQIKQVDIPAKLTEELSELNAGALPLRILEYKDMKNQVKLLQNTSLFPVLKDSTNVYQKVKLIHRLNEKLIGMDQLLSLIARFASDENKLNYQFYLKNFSPSFDGYLNTERTLVSSQITQIEKQTLELNKLSKLFIHKTDSIYVDSIAAKDFESHSYVRQLFENDTFLIIAGQKAEKPFIAKAQFNMKVESIQILEDSAQFLNMIEINDKILVNAALSNQSNQYKISSYDQQIKPLWSLEFQSDSIVVSAKEEAGILFLYNKEGHVVKTLDSKGKEIGK